MASQSVSAAVVLVHGLWMRGWVLALLGRRLAACGFRPSSFSYSSLRGELDDNARSLARFVEEIGAPTVHLIGHSLGGLVILRMLEIAASPTVGRVVLLGSPYMDSVAARRLARVPLARRLLGRSIPRWLEGARPQLASRFAIGVIAGSRGIGVGRLLGGIPKPNDGVVAVAETRLPGAAHRVLRVSHAGMLVSRAVADEACRFLKEGRFSIG